MQFFPLKMLLEKNENIETKEAGVVHFLNFKHVEYVRSIELNSSSILAWAKYK